MKEEITKKEILTKLIYLQARVNFSIKSNATAKRQFISFVTLVIVIELINLVFNWLVFKDHHYILKFLNQI